VTSIVIEGRTHLKSIVLLFVSSHTETCSEPGFDHKTISNVSVNVTKQFELVI
jgi:hypothetical protein